MKYWILLLVAPLLLIAAPEIRAHNLFTVNGNPQNHQHVYRRQEYGKPLQQGHMTQSSTGNGIIRWGSDSRPGYGQSTVRRRGPIIDDNRPNRGATPNKNKEYGQSVNRYGKNLQGYGKPLSGYGKPVRRK